MEIGYKNKVPTFYHFRIPESDLDVGLHALANGQDLLKFLDHFPKYKVADVFVEHLNTNLGDIDVNNREDLLGIGLDSDDGTESHESEFIVDDSNNLDGIDVDMTDFMEKLRMESDWVGLPIKC